MKLDSDNKNILIGCITLFLTIICITIPLIIANQISEERKMQLEKYKIYVKLTNGDINLESEEFKND